MGLSPYPSPADGGVLCIILVGTVVSLSMVKDFFLSLFNIAGLRISSIEQHPVDSLADFYDWRVSPSESYMNEFRTRTPTVKFESITQCVERECSVCLNEFENDNEVNHLSCGHVFHKVCLEKWLKYWNVTCPLCRTRIVPQEMEIDLFM